jgi:hypothetical protein
MDSSMEPPKELPKELVKPVKKEIIKCIKSSTKNSKVSRCKGNPKRICRRKKEKSHFKKEGI